MKVICETAKPSGLRTFGDTKYDIHKMWVYKKPRKKIEYFAVNGIPQVEIKYNLSIEKEDCESVKELVEFYHHTKDAKLELKVGVREENLDKIRLFRD